MDSSLVGQFTAVTGSSPSLAEQYLRLGDNDLEQAVVLYYANDGAELEVAAPSTNAPPVPPPSTRPQPDTTGYTDRNGVVHLDSDDDGDPDYVDEQDRAPHRERAPTQQPSSDLGLGAITPRNATPPTAPEDTTMDDDEAMARRLQEEFYGGSQVRGGANAAVDESGYRAPIARTTQTLVGPDSFDPNDPDEMRAAVMEQMMARRQPRNRERPGIFNQDPSGFSWNENGGESSVHRGHLSRATGGASESSSKANLLAEMYRPPFELISHLSWDEARDDGKQNEKWILVNIQDPSIFDCQLLNRDLWKNPGVIETVRENFIFMQYSKDNPRGSQYIQYYFQNKDVDSAYPHIAIVDPRTGEQVKVWSGPPAPKAMDFLMQLHEFLDRYSLKATAKNPVAKRKPEPRKEVQIDRMSEEQQLEMAMQASLAGAGGQVRESDPDDLTRSVGNLEKPDESDNHGSHEDEETPPTANGTSQVADNPFKRISSTNPHSEPAPEPATTTRIQFRHPNGRIVRRFALVDPVRRIFEWLKASPLEGNEGNDFELIFMQKNLLTVLDETIEEAGLRNGTVMIEFVEGA